MFLCRLHIGVKGDIMSHKVKRVCLEHEFCWFCDVFEFYGCKLDVFVTDKNIEQS